MNVDRERERYDSLPTVDSAVLHMHMTAFAHAFVIGRKRDRWLHLFGVGSGRDSHKLVGDLEPKRCRRIESVSEVPTHKGAGVYYNPR